MAVLNFKRKATARPVSDGSLASFLNGFSIEVMPRTAAKIEDFRKILPEGTRVYVAHIEGTPIEEMVETAKRLTDEGFPVMPHLPARIIADAATLENWIERYADVGVSQALLLAGGVDKPHGDFEDSMQLLGTGLFDKHAFKRLHVAGHPEGNKDIDPSGGDDAVMDALRWKNDFQNRTDAKMALATQFVFESAPVIEWANRLHAEGINIPIHIGIAGPAKLQTMIKFAMACGVGPSVRVLTRRAKDVTKLVMPFEPTQVLSELARHKAANPDFNIESVHFFPLGGINKTAEYTSEHGKPASLAAHA
ncbi:5,10-methylenetetrahydrofolate reductase [Rhodobacterales bacterium 52_120_T64]|nr:5,10-methylenetetrahydrofolate reductase [Rhodobacterales bacterium 52_120_T64]